VVPNPLALVLELDEVVAALAAAGFAIVVLAAGFTEFKIVGIV
jgi:phosphoserine phosphatase